MKIPFHKVPEKQDFSKYIQEFLDKCESYQESLSIAKNNSEGNIWLIGGSVYRPLLFGDRNQAKDFDFVIEKKINGHIPKKFHSLVNRFGSLKLICKEYNIDLIVLSDIHQIVKRNLESTIENYLSGTPLNIHSIAYDISRKEVIGNAGIDAVCEKVIRINNLQMALDMSKLYNLSLEEIMLKKAMELDFDIEYYKNQS